MTAARPRAVATAFLLAAALTLGACTSPPADDAWRSLVHDAAQQASSADYGGALATLASLEQGVTDARDGGELTAADADAILAAAATVRGDLESLASPAPQPSEPAVSPTTVSPATVAPAPSPSTDGGDVDDDEDSSPGNSSNGKGNSGNNGNSNGNGNGNGKSKNGNNGNGNAEDDE